jgi:hypothetical protein
MSPEYQLSPRVRLLAGDPVRVEGRRGLYRFVCVWTGEDGELYADVVGPTGSKRVELLRTVRADRLRSAGRALRAEVEMNAALREMTRRRKL